MRRAWLLLVVAALVACSDEPAPDAVPSTTTATAAPPPCEGSGPRVGIYTVTAVPPGFVPEGEVEHESTGDVDLGGESRTTQRFVDDGGRRLDVVELRTGDPSAYTAAHEGAPSREVVFQRCYTLGEPPVEWRSQVSATAERSILVSGEWEYGGFLVVGGPGVSTDELVLVAAGLGFAD